DPILHELMPQLRESSAGSSGRSGLRLNIGRLRGGTFRSRLTCLLDAALGSLGRPTQETSLRGLGGRWLGHVGYLIAHCIVRSITNPQELPSSTALVSVGCFQCLLVARTEEVPLAEAIAAQESSARVGKIRRSAALRASCHQPQGSRCGRFLQSCRLLMSR